MEAVPISSLAAVLLFGVGPVKLIGFTCVHGRLLGRGSGDGAPSRTKGVVGVVGVVGASGASFCPCPEFDPKESLSPLTSHGECEVGSFSLGFSGMLLFLECLFKPMCLLSDFLSSQNSC